MKRLITMLCSMLLLSNSLSFAAAEQAPVPRAVTEKQINYKAELKKLGLLKEESKDAALNLRNAVIRYQSMCNLAITGKWDNKCLSLLTKRLVTGSDEYADQIAAPPVSGKWITINKTKRILTLYKGNEVIQKYPVAVGNPPSLTPEGKFTIVSKVINPSWGGGGYAKPVRGGVPENPLGYRWLGLSYKNGSTLGIHGNNSPYSIGKNVSHGCIRMINSDVTQLFSSITQSAPVWIGSEAKLKEWGVIQPEYGTKPVLPPKKADKGRLPYINTSPAGATMKFDNDTAPAADGAVKVTYDEAVPPAGYLIVP